MTQPATEQTLVLIKPDALKNSLTGYVLSQLSEQHSGLYFAAAKIVHVHRMLAEEHYAEHREKPFFPALIKFITGMDHWPETPEKRRVIAFTFRGPGAVLKIREICGPTNPNEARDTRPGCIRSLGAVVPVKDAAGKVVGDRMDNLIHASANLADAEREIKIWFRPSDIPPLMRGYATEIATEHYYYSDERLTTSYAPGGVLLLGPGELAWKSDLEALRLLAAGQSAPISLKTIAAKYLINQ